MNITSGSLGCYYFLLCFNFLDRFFGSVCISYCSLYCFFNWGCRCLYFSHKLLPLLFFFFFLLVNFFLLCLLVLVIMFRFSLVEVTIEFVSSWTTLHIVLLIVISIIQISKVISTLLCPKRILLFLLFTIYQIVHLCSSSFTKFHIFQCIVFGVNFWSWFRLLGVLVIARVIWVRIPLITFIVMWTMRWVLFGRLLIKNLISFLGKLPFLYDTLTHFSLRLSLFCWLFSHLLYFRL